MKNHPNRYRHGQLSALVATALAVGLAVLGQQRPLTGDYLGQELRTRVAQLEQTSKTPTQNAEELKQRLQTLWEWGNAYALTGGPVPVDFASGVTRSFRILWGGNTGRARTLDPVNQFIAQYSWEFQTKDESPGALGKVTLSPSGPFRANTRAVITQIYTVGDLPIQTGGGIVVGLPRSDEEGDPADPGQDELISARSSNPAVRIERTEPWGEWNSFAMRNTIGFRVLAGTLQKGDQVVLSYGAGAGKGMLMQTWSNDHVILPVLVDPNGKGLALSPSLPFFEVVGAGTGRFVNAVAPSIVEPGEKFDVAVRLEDEFKNLSSGNTPEFAVTLNERPLTKIAAGSPALTQLRDLKIDRPGIYRFTVQSQDGSLRATSNPVWVRNRPPYHIYWGDTHGHSGFAEGQGSPDGYFRFGRDVARLDFLVLSEHDQWMDDWEWRSLQQATAKYLVPGKFTTILGYEWTAPSTLGGHHNVFFRTPEKRVRVPVQATPDLAALYAGLNKQYDPEDVLVIPHAHQAGDWRLSDAKLERMAEITSGHGTFEFFGNRYLQNGFEVGFVGAGDNHVGHPGYTVRNAQQGGLAGVIAPKNTPADIFTALRGRSAYATTGERIIMDVQLNGQGMGKRLPESNERKVTAQVMGTSPIESVDLIKNGNVIFQKRYASVSSFDSHVFVEVKLDSDSEVFSRANPRGPRPWRGSIEVKGARLVNLRTPAFLNPANDTVERDPKNPNRIAISLLTRGRGKGLVLELDGAGSATQIEVQIRESRERAGSPGPRDHPLAVLPAENLTFTLGNMTGGRDLRQFNVEKNIDSIEVQVLPAGLALDQAFEYSDHDDPKPGDYYYVRVVQVDGAMAWSSPFWVGGRSKQ